MKTRALDYIDESLWLEAGMKGFAPLAQNYEPDASASCGQTIHIIEISKIEPPERKSGVTRFDNNRLRKILEGFVQNIPLPPVKIITLNRGASECDFKLVDGFHRFYCSIRAGFTHIPAILWFDINSPDL